MTAASSGPGLGWIDIARLGLVQVALGSAVVLTTSTLNRVMVVELALAASLPGALFGLHYGVQMARPLWGHGSDAGAGRTRWILGGLALLALAGTGASATTLLFEQHFWFALIMAAVAFALIGTGIGAAGTSLLALLASRTHPDRRPAAATLVWMMMIAGIVVTAIATGALIEPYSHARLIAVTAGVGAIAFLLACVGVLGVEKRALPVSDLRGAVDARKVSFAESLRETWADPEARLFTVFVFISMLAYSTQDLILEPFGGLLFGMTPGETTAISGIQHAGVFVGMALVGIVGSMLARHKPWILKIFIVGGCIGSAVALVGLALAAPLAPVWPLTANIMLLGAANGAFAVAAIGTMMMLAGRGRGGREGIRMGLWGAAQAIAFGLGGFIGTLAIDMLRYLTGDIVLSFQTVFAAEAVLFAAAALIATRIGHAARDDRARRAVDPASSLVRSRRTTEADRFEVVVVGGGPSGAQAATDLAVLGHKVLLVDREGRPKPCGGAIPSEAMRAFDIPDHLVKARIGAARIVAPSGRSVDMRIGSVGHVAMIDRDEFDPYLRQRAENAGATRLSATFRTLSRNGDGTVTLMIDAAEGGERMVTAAIVIGADGANSAVRRAVFGPKKKPRYVFAYHEIVQSPQIGAADFDPGRCDVIYKGSVSPDFYGWIFPHGGQTSVGCGSAVKGHDLRQATYRIRDTAGLADAPTIRREGAPLPLKPMRRWDDGRNVVLVGDAAGVVAPSSGEGIYYAMLSGRLAAQAAREALLEGRPSALRNVRRRFMRSHGRIFAVLGLLQWVWYRNDKRREQFVAMCADPDVQRLTWQSYLNKTMVGRERSAHLRVIAKDIGQLIGLSAPR